MSRYFRRHQSKFNMRNTFVFISQSCAGSKVYKLKNIEENILKALTEKGILLIIRYMTVHVYCMGSGISCIISLTFELTNLHAINCGDKKI